MGRKFLASSKNWPKRHRPTSICPINTATRLIPEPDLLILDEPTNQLDLDMTEWLEEYLNRGSLSLLMVTHDRYFLDRVCSEIIEIDNRHSS